MFAERRCPHLSAVNHLAHYTHLYDPAFVVPNLSSGPVKSGWCCSHDKMSRVMSIGVKVKAHLGGKERNGECFAGTTLQVYRENKKEDIRKEDARK